MRLSKRLKQKRLKAIHDYQEGKRKGDPKKKMEANHLWNEIAEERRKAKLK